MIRRTRPSGTLVVAGLIALALVIFGAVVVATRTHHRRAAVDGARLRVPPLPSGGLPGFAKVVGVGFSSAREGAVWFSDAAGRYWQASTRDGGAHWTTVRGASYVLVSPGRFSGRDGVAVGQTSEGDIHTYVTHDGGVSWVPTSDAGLPNVVSAPSIAAGTIWTIGGRRCRQCSARILRGPAARGRPAPTAAQPSGLPWIVTAAGADVAYAAMVSPGDLTRQHLFVTHNAGRSWSPLPTQSCYASLLQATHDGSLWLQCLRSAGSPTVRVSDDGGHHWRTLTSPEVGQLNQISPISRAVAWGVSYGYQLMRTADGGQTWKLVADSHRAASTPMLDALSANHATLALPYPARDGRAQILVVHTGPGSHSSFVTLPRRPR